MARRASHLSYLRSPVGHAVRWLVSAIGLGLAFSTMSVLQVARAQGLSTAPSADDEPLRLKASPMLVEKPVEANGSPVPIFMFGDRLSGRTNLDTTLDGNAEVRRGKTSIRAERIDFYQPDDLLTARGKVRINSAGNQFNGDELKLKIDTFEGYFLKPDYRFLVNGGNGSATRIDFIDDQRLVATNATFTTCERGDEASWQPAWQLSGTSFRFDQEAETGEALGAVLRFKNIPILAFPAISFPLSSKRKSGLLPPTFNLDNTSGVEVSRGTKDPARIVEFIRSVRREDAG